MLCIVGCGAVVSFPASHSKGRKQGKGGRKERRKEESNKEEREVGKVRMNEGE